MKAKVTIENGEKFIVEYGDGSSHEFTYEQWMELRRVQNALIYTEPEKNQHHQHPAICGCGLTAMEHRARGI